MGTCILYPENCLLANSEGFCYLCDTITIEIDEIQSEEDQIPIVNEEVEGEEGEDNDNIKIDDIFGMRLL